MEKSQLQTEETDKNSNLLECDLNVRLHDSDITNEEIYQQLELVDLESAKIGKYVSSFRERWTTVHGAGSVCECCVCPKLGTPIPPYDAKVPCNENSWRSKPFG